MSAGNWSPLLKSAGHQELYTRQSPEQLARLREYAMVESAVSSNRIEGIEVDGDRVGTKVGRTSGRGVSARWLKVKNFS